MMCESERASCDRLKSHTLHTSKFPLNQMHHDTAEHHRAHHVLSLLESRGCHWAGLLVVLLVGDLSCDAKKGEANLGLVKTV